VQGPHPVLVPPQLAHRHEPRTPQDAVGGGGALVPPPSSEPAPLLVLPASALLPPVTSPRVLTSGISQRYSWMWLARPPTAKSTTCPRVPQANHRRTPEDAGTQAAPGAQGASHLCAPGVLGRAHRGYAPLKLGRANPGCARGRRGGR